MSVSGSSMYKPDEALHELMIQENILNAMVDTQTILQILVDKGIVTREEVSQYRNRVRNAPKYKATIESIEAQKKGFQSAKDNPEEYLRAIFKAKTEGKI